MSLWDDALAGAQEESREHWRQWRMCNCGKANSWLWNAQAKKQSPNVWTCGESECEHCRRIRAFKEDARMKSAVDEYGCVYTFYCTNHQWPKILRQFTYKGITKDKYRRLPMEQGNAIFFVTDDLDFVRFLEVETMTDSNPPKWTKQDDWYELARKKPGKRTSGNLGATEDFDSRGDGYFSYQVFCVYTEDVTAEHKESASDKAEEAVKNDEPKTHEEVVDVCTRWADVYESALQEYGYETKRFLVWRKWKITSLSKENGHNDVKSQTHSRRLAQEYLYPREIAEI